MKFGKDKRFIRKKPNVLKIPVGIDGIGEEKHPTIEEGIPQYQRDPIEEKVLNIVQGNYQEPEVKEEKQSKLKLYLNTIIN